jgi:hypothetical protein
MSLIDSAKYTLGSLIKLHIDYGVITYTLIALLATYLQHTNLQKDKECYNYQWVNTPIMILLFLILFSAFAAMLLPDVVQSLIDVDTTM